MTKKKTDYFIVSHGCQTCELIVTASNVEIDDAEYDGTVTGVCVFV